MFSGPHLYQVAPRYEGSELLEESHQTWKNAEIANNTAGDNPLSDLFSPKNSTLNVLPPSSVIFLQQFVIICQNL